MPLEFNPSLSPQVCFIASGRMHCNMNGLMHRKTVPEAIVAYVVNGSYEIECNGQREIIHEKELFLVPPDIPLEIIHYNGKNGFMHAEWIHFRILLGGHADFTSLLKMPLRVGGNPAGQIKKIIRTVLELQNKKRNLKEELKVYSEAYKLMDIVNSISEINETKLYLLEDERFLNIENYIKTNPYNKITIRGMAKAAGVSEAHLFKLFKTHYGLTPAAFANRRKILKAAEMLLSSNAKLYEISEELGFANPYHLSRVFKDYFKASPRSYKSDNELFKYKNIH